MFALDYAYLQDLNLERYKTSASIYCIEQNQSKQIDEFLEIIGYIESFNGKYTNHKKIEDGIHKGHRAAGIYGLMPNTIKEILNYFLIDGCDRKDFKRLIDSDNPKFIKKYTEDNPKIEKALARRLAKKVLLDTNYNEEKAAYMWFMGHNLSQDRVEKKYKNHFYVKRFRKFRDRLRDER